MPNYWLSLKHWHLNQLLLVPNIQDPTQSLQDPGYLQIIMLHISKNLQLVETGLPAYDWSFPLGTGYIGLPCPSRPMTLKSSEPLSSAGPSIMEEVEAQRRTVACPKGRVTLAVPHPFSLHHPEMPQFKALLVRVTYTPPDNLSPHNFLSDRRSVLPRWGHRPYNMRLKCNPGPQPNPYLVQ